MTQTPDALPMIVALDDAALTATPDLDAHIGGKAANLARMLVAGLPVPPGFVLTTRAFDRLVRDHLQGLTDTASLRAAILRAPLDGALGDALDRALDALTDARGDLPPLAVRSSAADEDGDTLSFAGQQATVLGVHGRDATRDAIRRVWASLFDEAAAVYRSQVSLEAVPPAMAVVVQRLVPARTAGVCFTANPVSQDRGELVVAAAQGLGQTVVSGEEADTYYIDRQRGGVRRRELVEQSTQWVVQDEGLTRAPIHAPSSLSDADLGRIATLALQIEDHFKAPQDIEWAFDDSGGLWALQTRPITTLGRRGDGRDAPGPEVWTNINVGEALPGVGTPMTWSILRSFSRRGFETAFGAMGLDVPERYALVGSFYGRVYLNLTQFASVITQIPIMSPEVLLSVAGGPSTAELLEGTYQEHSPRNFLLRLPWTVPKAALSQVSMPLIGARWARRFRKARDRFFARDMTFTSLAGLEERLKEVDRLFDRTGLVMLACSSNFLSSYMVTHELLQRWGGSEAASREHRLFSGLTGLRSAEPGLEMLRMAHHIRRYPKLERRFLDADPSALVGLLPNLAAEPGGAALRRRFDRFIQTYGHRAPREAEIATPRWREDPTFVFEVIQTYLRSPFLPNPDTLERERETERQETTQAVRRHFTTGLGWVFRQSLKLSQSNARLREDLRACVVDTLAMYRHVFLEIGRRLVQRGVLAAPEDVFFLTQDEARAALAPRLDLSNFPVRVALRRAEYHAFRRTPDPPETFTLLDGKIVASEPEPEGSRDLLRGLPGSAGRVTARARVVLDPSDPDATLKPGEILVAPFTDVGWTPLFLAASGVVMAKGGPLSHSCIVAREYGIPAAVNVKGAVELIQTGDLITLDGDTGTVYLPKDRAT